MKIELPSGPPWTVRKPSGRVAIIILAVLLIPAFNGNPVEAFKVDLHVWIAQQVMDEARGGYVTFQFTGEKTRKKIAIRPEVRRALQKFPEYFRMGSIGPDAFPDVFVGQTVIHPGSVGGWGTADWLRFLNVPGLTDEIRDQQRAFVLGHFIHAASDVFAHTFVNRYTGEIFDIKENEAAARRHVLLEDFVSGFVPKLTDVNRQFESYRQAVSIANGALAIPEHFVRDQLFFEFNAVHEMETSGKAAYVPLIAALRSRLREALDTDKGLVKQIEDLAVRLSAQYWLDINLSDEQAAKVRDLAERIHDMTDASEASIKLMDALDEQIYDTHIFAKGALDEVFKAKNNESQTMRKWASDLSDLATQIEKKTVELSKLPESNPRKICEDLCGGGTAGDICRELKKCSSLPTTDPIRDGVISALASLAGQRETALDQHKKSQEALQAAAKKAMDAVTVLLDAKLKLNKVAIEYFGPNQAETPVRRYLTNWQHDIELAMAELVVANGETITNLMDRRPDPVQPLKYWMECYKPGIVGIPILFNKAICEVRSDIDKFKTELDMVEYHLMQVLPVTEKIADLKVQLNEAVARLKKDVGREATNAITKELGGFLGVDLQMWMKALSEKTTVDSLTQEFSRDRSGRGLLVIPDIAKRVSAEMHLKDGKFDPVAFAAVHNAIVLSKMALLDADGLRELALYAGVSQSIYGSYLYSGTPSTTDNVLYGFARSIDGNNQWMRVAPPNPRQTGYDSAGFKSRAEDPSKGFTYLDDSCRPSMGMRMWTDPVAREKMFKRLFLGPVPAGVELPVLLGPGFDRILPATYPTTITEANVWGLDPAELPNGRPIHEFTIQGRGKTGQRVRLVQTEQVVGEVLIGESGNWSIAAKIRPSRAESLMLEYHNDARKKPRSTLVGQLATSFCVATPTDKLGEGLRQFVTVVEDSSLWSLAELLTGDGRNFVTLLGMNRDDIADPDRIYPGQILLLPRVDEWKY